MSHNVTTNIQTLTPLVGDEHKYLCECLDKIKDNPRKSGELKEYTEPFKVRSNTTIYAYALGDNARGEADKVIDNIGTETLADPIIKASPSSQQAESVEVTINYPQNAAERKYKIDNGTWQNYTGKITVSDNCTIYANAKKNDLTTSAEKKIENIYHLPIYVIDYGDYYLIKLNYPPGVKNKKYKYLATSEWREYKEEGFVLIKPGVEIGNDGIIKLVKNGKETIFKGDYYQVVGSISNIQGDIYMIWDPYIPSVPQIDPITTDPVTKLTVHINYDKDAYRNEYKIVNPDGTTDGYKVYKNALEITKNNTIIYARTVSKEGIESEERVMRITNIDERPPEIKLQADFETTSQKVNVKVVVTDDQAIETIMYAPGLQNSEYFRANGTLIQNQQTVTITENGEYTFYAKDRAGRTQLYTVTIDNIDNIPPTMTITENSESITTNLNVSIGYGDAVTKQYKIGNGNYQNYTGPIELDSYTVLANNQNSGSSVRVCAKGTDAVGNAGEVCKNTTLLDLDMPANPTITALGTKKPTLTEYGVVNINTISITYPSRSDVDNYYKVDNGQWIKYTGNFVTGGATIYAKSVKRTTGLTSSNSVSNQSSGATASGYLEPNAYDDDVNSKAPLRNRKLDVDSSMIGKQFYISFAYSGSNGSYGTFIKACNSSGCFSTLYEHTYGGAGSTTKFLTIPSGTQYLSFIGEDYTYVYDIRPRNEPLIAVTQHYPLLTNSGVNDGYCTAIINFDSTSARREYKIDSGSWTTYNNSEITYAVDSTIYARGYDANGQMARIVSSSTCQLPTKALPKIAYDGDYNNSINLLPVGSSNDIFYLYVDSSIWNKQAYFKMILEGHNSGSATTKVRAYKNDGTYENLFFKNNGGSWSINGNYTIPNDTKYLDFSGNCNLTVYEITKAI